MFGVSAATAVRFVAEHPTRGTGAAKLQGSPAGRFGKLAPHLAFLLDLVRAEPEITPARLSAALSVSEGRNVHVSSLHRAFERGEFST